VCVGASVGVGLMLLAVAQPGFSFGWGTTQLSRWLRHWLLVGWDWVECFLGITWCTQTHKSENSISANFHRSLGGYNKKAVLSQR